MNNGNSSDGPVSPSPLISVIVPAFNAAHYLERSLPPLIRLRERGEVVEVIVVDDCSTEASNVETASRLGASVLRMPKNGGPGAARNLAAMSSIGDVLWFVDADVVAHETGPRLLKETFVDPKVAAAFGSYDDRPPAANFASRYKNLVHRYYHQRGKEDSDTFWAGCGAVRKSVFLELGGFDGARYERPSIEDIELGHRMKAAGWSIRLIPSLLGTHLKEWTLPEVVKTDILRRAVPWSYLILSGSGMRDDLNVSSGERVKAGFAGLWLACAPAVLIPFFWPWSVLAFALLTAAIGVLNAPLFRFFARDRGLVFALAATAYHQIYYVYSAATFVYCAIKYRLRPDRVEPRKAPTADQARAA